jgi:hypothetical protein
MDDGAGGSFTSLDNSIDSSTFKYTISSGLTSGDSYRFKVTAYNDVGSVIGNIITVIAANVPDTPTNGPYIDTTETNSTTLTVLYD